MEVWRDILGFEHNYQVSNLGRIRTKDRYVRIGGGKERFVKGRIVKPTICTNGYYEIQMHINGKRKIKLLHRAVGEAFIPNPNNLPQINHKDENPANNSADNLEWCTPRYNANYGTRNQRMVKDKYLKPVFMMDKEGNILKRFNSIGDAVRETGADISSLIRVCKGRQNTCVGYKWKYA